MTFRYYKNVFTISFSTRIKNELNELEPPAGNIDTFLTFSVFFIWKDFLNEYISFMTGCDQNCKIDIGEENPLDTGWHINGRKTFV